MAAIGELGRSRAMHRMKIWGAVALCLLAVGCDDTSMDAVSFKCEATEQALPLLGRKVRFYHEGDFLFIQNTTGRADNVCSQQGMLTCDVRMTSKKLTLRQEIETPECEWHPSAKTTLDIDRHTGVFEFTQDQCDPTAKMVVKGTCEMFPGK
jgi:hypothetical protein